MATPLPLLRRLLEVSTEERGRQLPASILLLLRSALPVPLALLVRQLGTLLPTSFCEKLGVFECRAVEAVVATAVALLPDLNRTGTVGLPFAMAPGGPEMACVVSDKVVIVAVEVDDSMLSGDAVEGRPSLE